MAAANEFAYYTPDGRRVPFEKQEILALIQSGKIQANTIIEYKGARYQASKYPSLASMIREHGARAAYVPPCENGIELKSPIAPPQAASQSAPQTTPQSAPQTAPQAAPQSAPQAPSTIPAQSSAVSPLADVSVPAVNPDGMPNLDAPAARQELKALSADPAFLAPEIELKSSSTCPHCGASDVRSVFCPNCGKNVTKNQEPSRGSAITSFCPKCGAKSSGSPFCSLCGAPMAERASAQQSFSASRGGGMGTNEDSTFFGALCAGFRKFGTFSGRASREEFWYFFVWTFLVFWLSGGLLALAFVIPMITVTARRLHDAGFSGWWQILGPFHLILCAVGSEPGANRFGPSLR